MMEEAPTIPIPENLGSDIKMFSPDACKYLLQKRKSIIYSLSGKSIEELEEESGIQLARTETIERYEDFIKKQRSIKSQVAIDPDELFLDMSGNKPYQQQKRIVDTDGLSIRVYGVRPIIGRVADYFALYVMHLKETGEDLFGIKNENGRNLAVAELLTDNSEIAILGHLIVDNDIFVVTTLHPDYKHPKIMVAPFMVPL